MGEQKKQQESLRSKHLRTEAEAKAKAESEQTRAAIQPLINETVDEIKKMGAAVKKGLEEGVEVAKDTLQQIRDGNEIDSRILSRTEEGNQQWREITSVTAEGSRETGLFNRFSKRIMVWALVVAILGVIVAFLSIPSLQSQIERFVPWVKCDVLKPKPPKSTKVTDDKIAERPPLHPQASGYDWSDLGHGPSDWGYDPLDWEEGPRTRTPPKKTKLKRE